MLEDLLGPPIWLPVNSVNINYGIYFSYMFPFGKYTVYVVGQNINMHAVCF